MSRVNGKNRPTEPCLISKNFKEIFQNQVIWFVDDTNHKSSKPMINYGSCALLVFSLRTGQLFFKVIENHLSEWKTGEELAALVRSLPVEEQPKKIIVNRKRVLNSLQVDFLKHFPNIVMRETEVQVPFHASLNTAKLGGLVDYLLHQAAAADNKPLMVSLNLYDDWLFKGLSPSTAFYRLMIILGALALNSVKAKMLLNPPQSCSVVTHPYHIWPSFTADQWFKVEVAMKHLIVSEYANKNKNKNKNNTSAASKQSEIRNIPLGAAS